MTVEFLQAFSDLSPKGREIILAYMQGAENALTKSKTVEHVCDNDKIREYEDKIREYEDKLREHEHVESVERRLREYVLNGGGEIDTTNFTRDDFQTLGEINARLANR